MVHALLNSTHDGEREMLSEEREFGLRPKSKEEGHGYAYTGDQDGTRAYLEELARTDFNMFAALMEKQSAGSATNGNKR